MTYPIVLAHGVCRFDIFWKDRLNIDGSDNPKKDRLHYFKGIRTMLNEKGFDAYHSNVGWAVGVDQRAADLKQNILTILNAAGAEGVNIIAHSMGGLDARHMLFNDRHRDKIHERVASLTTISTPHEGSPFADWGTENLPYVIPVAKKLGLDLDAIEDLKTDVCKAFNRDPQVVEFEKSLEGRIKFQTFAGRQSFWGIFDALKLPYYIIEKEEGENDGLVSVLSARWRQRYFQGTLDETDHLNELGWWDYGQFLDGESEGELLTRIHKLYADIAMGLP
jgi:triacylglycerol lipase